MGKTIPVFHISSISRSSALPYPQPPPHTSQLRHPHILPVKDPAPKESESAERKPASQSSIPDITTSQSGVGRCGDEAGALPADDIDVNGPDDQRIAYEQECERGAPYGVCERKRVRYVPAVM
ncbi:hypothetical protein R3P38DRAFT_3184036 [Favolaschia claudopus]|uniref:Uncharacterized protein n=1 Tax=Favolaschia claudopus TaxID=2862362 RepID=A0AAW0CCR8_9AGAR